MTKSVAFYTLGCKLNFSETSTIARQMREHGFVQKEFNEAADIYVINTCSVTDHADRKCKKVVKEALSFNPQAFIIIIGCYAQLKPKEISEIPGVDMVLGASEKFELVNYLNHLKDKQKETVIFNSPIKELNTFVPGFSMGDRTRTFFKVQDGCDYFCSFCTIPLARGKSRSNTVEETINIINSIADSGIKEVVLTGVNLGDFGVQNNETFFDLMVKLEEVKGIERYRISSIEPNLLTPEIIDWVAHSKKFMPHFHIPLQSGSDEMLKSMRRKYNTDLYRSRIDYIKAKIPHCCIGVDVIVGYPGETDELFLQTYEFINQLDVSYLHVFPYSERSNTTAAKLKPKVHQFIRNERTEQLRILSEKKKRAFYNQFIDSKHFVLFENEEKSNKMFGFTENYIKVEADYDPLYINEIVEVEIKNINNNGHANALINYTITTHTHVS